MSFGSNQFSRSSGRSWFVAIVPAGRLTVRLGSSPSFQGGPSSSSNFSLARFVPIDSGRTVFVLKLSFTRFVPIDSARTVFIIQPREQFVTCDSARRASIVQRWTRVIGLLRPKWLQWEIEFRRWWITRSRQRKEITAWPATVTSCLTSANRSCRATRLAASKKSSQPSCNAEKLEMH